jgi:hypothetical protein
VTLPDASPFPRQGIWKCPSHRRPRQTIKSASSTILGGAGLVLHRHLNVDGEIAGEASANPDFNPLYVGRVISQVLTEREMGLEMHETSPGACFLALSQSFSKYSVLGLSHRSTVSRAPCPAPCPAPWTEHTGPSPLVEGEQLQLTSTKTLDPSRWRDRGIVGGYSAIPRRLRRPKHWGWRSSPATQTALHVISSFEVICNSG